MTSRGYIDNATPIAMRGKLKRDLCHLKNQIGKAMNAVGAAACLSQDTNTKITFGGRPILDVLSTLTDELAWMNTSLMVMGSVLADATSRREVSLKELDHLVEHEAQKLKTRRSTIERLMKQLR
jgi:hypothetical protein